MTGLGNNLAGLVGLWLVKNSS